MPPKFKNVERRNLYRYPAVGENYFNNTYCILFILKINISSLSFGVVFNVVTYWKLLSRNVRNVPGPLGL